MNIEEIEAAANEKLFDRLGVDALVQVPGQLSYPRRILIERDAEVVDSRGVVLERRCEIGLKVADVGDGERGILVDTGKPNDCWITLKSLGHDGYETRWIAGRHNGQ